MPSARYVRNFGTRQDGCPTTSQAERVAHSHALMKLQISANLWSCTRRLTVVAGVSPPREM